MNDTLRCCFVWCRCDHVRVCRNSLVIPTEALTLRYLLNGIAAGIVATSAIWPSPGWAWGGEGHQIIAHIAATELMPAARAQVEELLGGTAEEAMVEASTWADEIRPQRRATASWHFVDIPIGSGGYDARRDCPRANCVVAQIDRDERILADRALLAPVRAEALRFLIHFVGDIHQPLHAADNHDRGGNDLKVVLGGRQSNMHSIWDVDVLRPLGRNGGSAASRLEGAITQSQIRAWQFGTAADWANESFRIATQEIYSAPSTANSTAPIILPREYPAIEENIVRAQIEKAGLRLAWVLNRALQ